VGLRKGDYIISEYSGLQGIVLGFKYSEYNSYYHKTVIYCTFAPAHEYYKVNKIIEINSNIVKRKK
jgi:hypothetical protein